MTRGAKGDERAGVPGSSPQPLIKHPDFILAQDAGKSGGRLPFQDFLALTRQNPPYTTAYYYLGQSLGKQQNLGEAPYYLGVYYLKKRDNKNAAVQLKQALKHLQDADKRKQVEDWLAKMGGERNKKKKP